MFENLMTRRRESRETQLKGQFENASLYVRDLGDEPAERFKGAGRTLCSMAGSSDSDRSRSAKFESESMRSRK
jgi:hypothetical protein